MTKSRTRICPMCDRFVVDHGGVDTHTDLCPGPHDDSTGGVLLTDHDPQGNLTL